MLSPRLHLRAEAALLLVRVCWSLKRRPYAETRRWACALGRRHASGAVDANIDPQGVADAVASVSRLLPPARCLAQALATNIMLARRGYESEVHIGVPEEPSDEFVAHAWVTSQDRVVIGGPTTGYRELKPPPPPSR